jgi:hypothetical protein
MKFTSLNYAIKEIPELKKNPDKLTFSEHPT